MTFLGPNRTEIMFMIFFQSNIVEHIFLDSLEAILTSICIFSGYFMFKYMILSIEWADIFGLQ